MTRTSLLDKIQAAVFENSGDSPAPSIPSYPTAAPTAALPSTHYADLRATTPFPLSAIADNTIYQHFLEITNPSKFDQLARFNLMMDKLARSVPDKSMRMKAAIDLSGATVDILLNNIASMRQSLQDELKQAQQKLKETGVAAAAEVERLQKLLAVATASYQKTDSAQSAVSSAAARRSADLDQMEKEFNSLK